MSLSVREREAVLFDLQGYRRFVASLLRTHTELVAHAEHYAAKVLAAELVGDYDTARFAERIAARMRREALAAHERRATYLEVIRELEGSLA